MASRAQTPLWRETVKAGAARSGAMIVAVTVAALSLLLILSLASYHSGDPSLSTAAGGPAQNLLGYPGAVIADLAYTVLGWPAWGMLAIGPVVAWRLWRDEEVGGWGRMALGAAFGLALVATAQGFVSSGASLDWPAGKSGLVGMLVADGLKWLIALIGIPSPFCGPTASSARWPACRAR